MNVFKIGIIGFGNIGKKRFLSILKIKKYNVKIVYVVDKTVNKKNIPRNIKFINTLLSFAKIDFPATLVSCQYLF